MSEIDPKLLRKLKRLAKKAKKEVKELRRQKRKRGYDTIQIGDEEPIPVHDTTISFETERLGSWEICFPFEIVKPEHSAKSDISSWDDPVVLVGWNWIGLYDGKKRMRELKKLRGDEHYKYKAQTNKIFWCSEPKAPEVRNEECHYSPMFVGPVLTRKSGLYRLPQPERSSVLSAVKRLLLGS